jgi:hypothetical protein
MIRTKKNQQKKSEFFFNFISSRFSIIFQNNPDKNLLLLYFLYCRIDDWKGGIKRKGRLRASKKELGEEKDSCVA